ncbi:MAG: DNA polymerase III subunit gamma/tau [Oscillibacter sp.]|nr:DNA polymerase III subunit gamma/tau [Oscillibacter sp.]
MYQALYRKWRPKTFADVIGQEHITDTLRRQVAEGRTSHAYLFTGTRGTGKTTCAKILAKAVNCENPAEGDPCGKCPSCLGIDSGNFLDVLELDAASNNGVDQVRALRDEAVYSPANVKKRVYIVDEVHMLSTAAFNALLKILEEPPEHLMFILATTELHKVPATILSRCQRFSFRRIQPQDVARRLSYVAERESIDLRPDGAEILSRLADGALRDGLSLLDQCAAAGGTIDASAVLDVLGLAGNLQTAQLMERILNRDAQAALLLLDGLYKGGKDMGAALSELSVLTRDLLLQKTAPEGGAALLSGGFDAATLDRLGKGVPASRFLHLASTLQRATAELYASANRRLDAELCLLRLCDESLSGDLTALEARVRRLEDNQSARAELAKRPPPPPREEISASPDPPPWEEPPLPEEPPAPDEPGQRVYDIPEKAAPKAAPVPAAPPAVPAASPAKVMEGGWWRTLAENCKGRLPPMYRPFLSMCSGFLEGDLLTVCAPDDLTLGRLDNDRVREVLTQEAEALAGGPVRLTLRAGTPPQTSPEENLKNLLEFSRQFDNIEIK